MSLLYSDPAYSLKDACLAFEQGVWHLFTSAFDQERSVVARSRSPDLISCDPIETLFDGLEQDRIGMCSPDVMKGPEAWILVCNSWGQKKGFPNALYYGVSEDLTCWRTLRPLAQELTAGTRVIDGSLAWHEGTWFLICKCPGRTRCAQARSLDGPWEWIPGEMKFLDGTTGEPNEYHRENFQFLQLDGVWHVVSTDFVAYSNQNYPWLYRMEGDPLLPESWLRWTQGRALELPTEEWNSLDAHNAVALVDHRSHDGWVYAIFGGKDEQRKDEFCGTASEEKHWARGWNRLGTARSRDLVRWGV